MLGYFRRISPRFQPAKAQPQCVAWRALCWCEFSGRWEAGGDCSDQTQGCSSYFSFSQHCSGTVGEVVPHLSFQLRYETQGLLSCSGTDVEGEVLFLWHMLCETFPSFFFSFLKKSQFWFQYPKKRQQCCQSYLLISEIIIKKRQNILGSVWASAGWNGWGCWETTQCSQTYGEISEWFCSHVMAPHYLIMQLSYSNFICGGPASFCRGLS